MLKIVKSFVHGNIFLFPFTKMHERENFDQELERDFAFALQRGCC